MPQSPHVVCNSADQPDEASLVKAARAGDPSALAILYARYATDLYSMARRITGADQDAEDVLHDVFVGLPQLLLRYTQQGRLGGWLRRVTIRLALMHLRRDQRRREVDLVPEQIPAMEPRAGVDEMELSAALDALPETLRSVFVLKQLEGLTHAEIASLLGISGGASRVRYLRALRRLRQLLEPDL